MKSGTAVLKCSPQLIFLAFVGVGVTLFWLRGVPRPHATRAEPLEIQIAKPRDALPIRVNLTPTRVRNLEITVDGPYQIRPLESPRIVGSGKRLKTTKVVPTNNGLSIGHRHYSFSQLEIEPLRSTIIWVGDHLYRGNVRLIQESGETLIAVNVLPLEQYLASVVDSEMPATFPPAARRAQAIAARTYAMSRMKCAQRHPYFDLDATQRSQKYLGYQYRDQSGRCLAGEGDNSRRIVSETAGMVCTYQGELIRTYYSAVCGGRTTVGRAVFSDAAAPLKSVICQWCRPARLYRWRTELSKQDVSNRLSRYFQEKRKLFGPLVSITQGIQSVDGVVSTFVVADARWKLLISAADLRRLLPASILYSSYFSVREAGGQMFFEGRGHGHCVGMCQWGARGLALAGRTCVDIIRYYYPGVEVVVFGSESN